MSQDFIRQFIADLNLSPIVEGVLVFAYTDYQEAIHQKLSEEVIQRRYSSFSKACYNAGVKASDVLPLLQEPIICPIPEFDIDQEKRFKQLVSFCKPIEGFTYKGIMFSGNNGDAVREYLQQETKQKFLLWLQQNWPIIKK